ncbi:MAG TPA: alpha/beta fold hydrolase [Solirubrobacteraceae bacterium]|nr:alpha/beta fold hydrolase [Solirubrobacteraceae bacterium]
MHLPYGPHHRQYGDLRVPAGAGRFAVCVLVHGGGWQARYTPALMAGLAADLVARGWATWNLEFRGIGADGGWPATFDDVAAGIDHLDALDAPLDLDRVVAVGHSAGGTLALWAGARRDPAVPLRAIAAQAPVSDLRLRAGADPEGLLRALLGGGPDDVPDRYAAASPLGLLPLGVPQLLVHGGADAAVPAAMSRRYVESARAKGDRATLVVCPGGDHNAHLDPRSRAWATVVAWLAPWGP